MDAVSLATAVTAQSSAMVQATISTSVLRKVLDFDKVQAAMLTQLMDAQAGLGTTINTVA